MQISLDITAKIFKVCVFYKCFNKCIDEKLKNIIWTLEKFEIKKKNRALQIFLFCDRPNCVVPHYTNQSKINELYDKTTQRF